jgi:regulation of enolase protein 1 (concanavalin A-like superfamily)
MNRLLLAAMLGSLGPRVTATDPDPKEKVLFEDQFADRLGDGWSWIREDPRAWRIHKGALILRNSPGHLYASYNNAKNVLVRTLPRTEHTLAIEVHVESDPKVQFEHAGVVWYVDDDNFVSLFQEVLGGKVVLQMVAEKGGKARTIVAEHGTKAVWLRLVISGGTITSQYRLSEDRPWREVGRVEIPSQAPARAGVTAGGAPKDADRDVHFRSFRILEITND